MGLTPGDFLGRYQIQREIGRGGMGAIYLARDTVLRRPVALKVLSPSAADGGGLRERFVREAQAAAKICHRNVVAVHDVCDGEPPFIVLEYLQGETLDALLKRDGPLPLARALDLLLPVISAVRAAHEAGVIHRDLKPANIMLARERDGELTPKVLDFGISRIAQVTGLFHAASPAGSLDLTGEGDCMGTPSYMPPEQHGAQQLVGPWSDVYALGLMLYVALTGKRAFPGRSAPEVLRSKLLGAFEAPSARAPGLPRELDAWMTRALARDVSQRFQGVQEMARALLAFAPPEARARWGASFEAPDDVLEVSALDDAPDDERTTRVRDAAEIVVEVELDADLPASTKLSTVVPAPAPRSPREGRGWGPGALGGALLLAAAALVGRWASVRAPMTPRAVSSAARPAAPPRAALPPPAATRPLAVAPLAGAVVPAPAAALVAALPRPPRAPARAAGPLSRGEGRVPEGFMRVNGHLVPRPSFGGSP